MCNWKNNKQKDEKFILKEHKFCQLTSADMTFCRAPETKYTEGETITETFMCPRSPVC